MSADYDWVDDETLSEAEILERFEALPRAEIVTPPTTSGPGVSILNLVGLDPNFTDGLSSQEYKYAISCGRYEQCMEAEGEAEDWKRECEKREAQRVKVLELCARPRLSFNGVDYLAVHDVRSILEGPVTP